MVLCCVRVIFGCFLEVCLRDFWMLFGGVKGRFFVVSMGDFWSRVCVIFGWFLVVCMGYFVVCMGDFL